uniref:Uncharacterized protein n=1 Tax=Vespula pensylvanica TaxID=30213 RepID=A0A834PDA8_VESPE|nr:hypothetical protein H0235_000167 [Vespula pensylvanica]
MWKKKNDSIHHQENRWRFSSPTLPVEKNNYHGEDAFSRFIAHSNACLTEAPLAEHKYRPSSTMRVLLLDSWTPDLVYTRAEEDVEEEKEVEEEEEEEKEEDKKEEEEDESKEEEEEEKEEESSKMFTKRERSECRGIKRCRGVGFGG